MNRTQTIAARRPEAASILARACVAIVVGLAAGMFCSHYTRFYTHPPDIAYWWKGARVWIHTTNPYAVRLFAEAGPPNDRLLYPLTAIVIFAPFAWLPLPIAAAAFTGLSCAWLAWLVTREGEWWRLLLFVSPSALMAVKFGQWSPLLTAAMLVPGAGWLLAAKPTIGAALFAARPSWRALVGNICVLAISLALWPGWPAAWLINVRSVPQHGAPVLSSPVMPVALLALLRWRVPEGRLVAAMACVPQLLFFYDQLPLMLVAQSRTEALILSLTGSAAFAAWELVVLAHSSDYLRQAAPYVVAGCYLPALAMVLARRRATVPAWEGQAA